MCFTPPVWTRVFREGGVGSATRRSRVRRDRDRASQVDAPQCKRCGVTKVKLEFEGVDFKGMRGRSYFFVLASKDAVKKSWSK